MSDPLDAAPIPEQVRSTVEEVFGDRLPLAVELARFLGTAGLDRGLMGPRELPRLWERHLLNCAVVTELLPANARVVDVGSGAGLPGLVLACRRSDLRVDLVESLQRRVDFLSEAVGLLDLGSQVRVVHGRAEDASVVSAVGSSAWVTARAVAPLDRLARWCLPLLGAGGSLLAMKGDSAADEIAEHRSTLTRLGVGSLTLTDCGTGVVSPAVRVVVATRSEKARAVIQPKTTKRSNTSSPTQIRKRP